jgi:class 3 adenylate cyclase
MTAVELRCEACGQANPPGARFCSSCGAPLEAVTPQQEERKLVSVLFIDLVDSTARADRADPEDVRDLLQIYHREAKECIERYGGVLEKFIGDAVMALFGAPVAHGDDAERAVRAGLRVLERIEHLNEEHQLDLAARAAVNTGEAIVSVEHARRGGALATGDVVNTAARLQNAAPAGRVIVGAETYRATRHAVRYEELAAIEAKGKADAVDAWLAIEAATAPADRPLGIAPLVGRDRELEVLRSVWGRALDERRPHLVTLVGPPGIGKSRLCREIASLVDASGGRILRGRCLPYEERSGYQAFSRIVHHLSGIFESDSPAAARPKLEATVRELLPEDEAAEALRHLLLLLGLAPDDEVPTGALLLFAARRFVECTALAQPTVFVFEDVHWADASELALLGYLAQHTRDAPALLVATARPELLDIEPTWGTGLGAQTTMPLEPLAEDAARALAERLVAGDGATVVDPGRLVDVAGGNPLFLEELAASVAEVGGEELPVTVREAIAARIDALPGRARDALLSAAVIGKTFWRASSRPSARSMMWTRHWRRSRPATLCGETRPARLPATRNSPSSTCSFAKSLTRRCHARCDGNDTRRSRTTSRTGWSVTRSRRSSPTTGARRASPRVRSRTSSTRPTRRAEAGRRVPSSISTRRPSSLQKTTSCAAKFACSPRSLSSCSTTTGLRPRSWRSSFPS